MEDLTHIFSGFVTVALHNSMILFPYVYFDVKQRLNMFEGKLYRRMLQSGYDAYFPIIVVLCVLCGLLVAFIWILLCRFILMSTQHTILIKNIHPKSLKLLGL